MDKLKMEHARLVTELISETGRVDTETDPLFNVDEFVDEVVRRKTSEYLRRMDERLGDASSALDSGSRAKALEYYGSMTQFASDPQAAAWRAAFDRAWDAVVQRRMRFVEKPTARLSVRERLQRLHQARALSDQAQEALRQGTEAEVPKRQGAAPVATASAAAAAFAAAFARAAPSQVRVKTEFGAGAAPPAAVEPPAGTAAAAAAETAAAAADTAPAPAVFVLPSAKPPLPPPAAAPKVIPAARKHDVVSRSDVDAHATLEEYRRRQREAYRLRLQQQRDGDDASSQAVAAPAAAAPAAAPKDVPPVAAKPSAVFQRGVVLTPTPAPSPAPSSSSSSSSFADMLAAFSSTAAPASAAAAADVVAVREAVPQRFERLVGDDDEDEDESVFTRTAGSVPGSLQQSLQDAQCLRDYRRVGARDVEPFLRWWSGHFAGWKSRHAYDELASGARSAANVRDRVKSAELVQLAQYVDARMRDYAMRVRVLQAPHRDAQLSQRGDVFRCEYLYYPLKSDAAAQLQDQVAKDTESIRNKFRSSMASVQRAVEDLMTPPPRELLADKLSHEVGYPVVLELGDARNPVRVDESFVMPQSYLAKRYTPAVGGALRVMSVAAESVDSVIPTFARARAAAPSAASTAAAQVQDRAAVESSVTSRKRGRAADQAYDRANPAAAFARTPSIMPAYREEAGVDEEQEERTVTLPPPSQRYRARVEPAAQYVRPSVSLAPQVSYKAEYVQVGDPAAMRIPEGQVYKQACRNELYADFVGESSEKRPRKEFFIGNDPTQRLRDTVGIRQPGSVVAYGASIRWYENNPWYKEYVKRHGLPPGNV